jgi:hypothetical protein
LLNRQSHRLSARDGESFGLGQQRGFANWAVSRFRPKDVRIDDRRRYREDRERNDHFYER